MGAYVGSQFLQPHSVKSLFPTRLCAWEAPMTSWAVDFACIQSPKNASHTMAATGVYVPQSSSLDDAFS